MKRLKPVKTIDIDLKDIEMSLQNHKLIDNRALWFAGYDDTQRASHNAIAANLLYGNKRLQIISICETAVYKSMNSKEGFVVYHIGDVSQGVWMTSIGLLHPSVSLTGYYDYSHVIKVTKNKANLKSFRKGLKK